MSRNWYGVDRRYNEDQRQIYDLSYFANGGIERRIGTDRRRGVERRAGWVLTEGQNSVYLGTIVSTRDTPVETSGQETPPDRMPNDDRRHLDRHRLRKIAYVIYGPKHGRVGRVLDINRQGVRCLYRGQHRDLHKPHTLDLFLAGGRFIVRSLNYEVVSRRVLDSGSDTCLPLLEWRLHFVDLSGEKTEALDQIIRQYQQSGHQSE